MQASAWFCLLLAGVAVVCASYENDLYQELQEDMLLQELERRLSDIGADNYYDDPYNMPDSSEYGANSIPLELRDSGQADIRDSEYLEHSAQNEGFQHISGGAGEGEQHLTPEGTQQNVQEVKTDEALPFYCHPPNPCPKGFTEKDGCQEFIEDSAEDQKMWISKMQSKGLCACDEEHMFDCPKELDTINTEKGSQAKDALDVILDGLSDKSDNPYVLGMQRKSLAAKKSPRVKRSADSEAMIDAELDRMKEMMNKKDKNPYMRGKRVFTYAKKG